ncbi:zincin-like metallopeptidase domain-containing protein [Mucilaginibacter lacusdianchii]|uniref:zincin-like metallopeptidase domain-containing protein n=1 Tax=Mucilaginibacter lacusdianchii TaxID=2684211 RepID=UPI00131E32AB|nr:zincin-like metallopeptidase domain-containing protein [Mucilaginibacter sp. JXJ CY 39]
MAKNFKALPVQLSEKLVQEIKDGTSLFQQPVQENGRPAFVTPVNPVTGKGYSAMNALILGMQRHEDPRWLSFDAARFAGTPVKKDAAATMIEFSKRTEIQKMRTPDDKPIKNEEGVTQTRTVTFDKPQPTKSFLFNGSQLNGIEPLEEYLSKMGAAETLNPVEKAANLLESSGATIIEGGQEAYYDQKRDVIFLPEKSAFENETKYYQTAIHQLAHWSGHESRLNRPMEGKFGSLEYAREELRAAIAAILIGGQLKLGHDFGQQKSYMGAFAKILKDEPFEVAKAARDAQRITGLLLGTGRERIQKQAAAKPPGFAKGDEIAYLDTAYKVLEVYKNKSIKVEDTQGTKRTVKPSDGLFQSLLEAKTNPRGEDRAVGAEPELQQTYKMTR